jgi:hypothetical protein
MRMVGSSLGEPHPNPIWSNSIILLLMSKIVYIVEKALTQTAESLCVEEIVYFGD